MNLYLYDDMNQQVIDEIQINNLDEAQRIIRFLNKNRITDRYKMLVIAESYRTYSEESESYIEFEY
jgi:hypothetical protein